MVIKGYKLLDFDKIFKKQPLPRQYRFENSLFCNSNIYNLEDPK